MRDYSFGNFISALRERCGLSQYQLGALVGVSDKAVSKWENGASKPRIGTIRKLSEVLDVSVDELLTCEYATFDKERKDLFAMKKEIINIAKNKLRELYGDNPPIRIANRFKTEELILDGQETLLWMGFFGKLQEEFCVENAYFDIRGAQMGASFIAWLLSGTNVNPLPAHYYCPICKKVEFVSDEKCGIDLPDKKCSCGNNYHKDGFGIDAINMYPFCRWNEIYVSSNGTELAKKCLQEYFKGYGEIRELKITYDEAIEVHSSEQIMVTKFGLLSKELNKKFPEGVITLQPEEYSRLLDELSVLTVIENVEEQMSSQDLLNMEFTAQQIKAYYYYAVESGKYDGYAGDMNLGKVLSDIENPKFSDLLALSGFLHSTGAWKGNAEFLYDKGILLGDLISCREDVYGYLYDKLNGKCCDNPSGQVFEIKEAVRKGKYSNNRMPVEIERLLLECEVPEWYVESMKKILYLFPKTHLIVLLKRNICKFAMMNNL
uniref:helix-turn-helix domain-containing protein n=1 Tax=Acetatifactor sp. TaxID=1872090 RepID=UPI0040564767